MQKDAETQQNHSANKHKKVTAIINYLWSQHTWDKASPSPVSVCMVETAGSLEPVIQISNGEHAAHNRSSCSLKGASLASCTTV